MKKILIVLVLLLVTSALFAQEYGKIGIGVELDVTTNSVNDVTDITTSTTDYLIEPSLSIMLNDKLELLPALRFAWSSVKVDGTKTSGDTTLGLGCELLWHMIRKPHFRMGTGAGIGAGYYWQSELPAGESFNGFGAMIYMPVFIDIPMAKWLSFRVSVDLIRLDIQTTVDSTAAGDETEVDIIFDSVKSVGDIIFGLYFRFG